MIIRSQGELETNAEYRDIVSLKSIIFLLVSTFILKRA